MDKRIIDGWKTEIQKSQKTNQSITNSGDLETYGRNSGGIEYQSQRASGKVDGGMGQTGIRWIIGGILGLFREVIDEALSYMDEHGERLEKRLTDHKNKKASFLEKSAALEKEISRLLEQVEKLPEEAATEEE